MSKITKKTRAAFLEAKALKGDASRDTIAAALAVVAESKLAGQPGTIDVDELIGHIGAHIRGPIQIEVADKTADAATFLAQYDAAIQSEVETTKAQWQTYAKTIVGIATTIIAVA